MWIHLPGYFHFNYESRLSLISLRSHERLHLSYSIATSHLWNAHTYSHLTMLTAEMFCLLFGLKFQQAWSELRIAYHSLLLWYDKIIAANTVMHRFTEETFKLPLLLHCCSTQIYDRAESFHTSARFLFAISLSCSFSSSSIQLEDTACLM